MATNLLLHLSVAEHKQRGFLSHPTHSQETRSVQLPKTTSDIHIHCTRIATAATHTQENANKAF